MPAPLIKSFAEKIGIPVKTVEKYWKEIKEELLEQYNESDPKFYGTLVKILKRRLNKYHGAQLKVDGIICGCCGYNVSFDHNRCPYCKSVFDVIVEDKNIEEVSSDADELLASIVMDFDQNDGKLKKEYLLSFIPDLDEIKSIIEDYCVEFNINLLSIELDYKDGAVYIDSQYEFK